MGVRDWIFFFRHEVDVPLVGAKGKRRVYTMFQSVKGLGFGGCRWWAGPPGPARAT